MGFTEIVIRGHANLLLLSVGVSATLLPFCLDFQNFFDDEINDPIKLGVQHAYRDRSPIPPVLSEKNRSVSGFRYAGIPVAVVVSLVVETVDAAKNLARGSFRLARFRDKFGA